jgi:hypothetical protein
MGFPGLAFHSPRRVGQPRHRDFGRGGEFQSEITGLADIGRKVTAGLVHRARQRLVGEVDHELAGAFDIDRGVLGQAVGSQIGGEHAERRVLAEHVEEAERGGVDHAGRANRRHPGDRPRQHESRQHLVALALGEVAGGVLHDEFPVERDFAYLAPLAGRGRICA